MLHKGPRLDLDVKHSRMRFMNFTLILNAEWHARGVCNSEIAAGKLINWDAGNVRAVRDAD